MAAIGEIAEVNPAPSRQLNGDGGKVVSFVSMAGVSEQGELVQEEERRLADVPGGCSYFAKGDVLLAKITPCMENGKAAHVRELRHEVGFGSTEFHVLRPGPEVDGRYLFYMVWNPRFRFVAERNMTGTAGQKRVPAGFVREFHIPLPDKREQQRIAAILDKADAIRRKRKETIALTEELLRSTFLEMFGDPMTNPKRWPTKPIREIATVTTGNTPPRENPAYYGNSIEWIKSDNINTRHHFVTKAAEGLSAEGGAVGRVAPVDSTLITCIAGSRDCIGNAALTNREVAFNQQINALTANEDVDPYFLYVQVLLAKRLIQTASTNSMKGMVSKGRLEDVELIVPPEQLQRQFGDYFGAFIGLTRKVTCFHEESEQLFGSLVQRAFRGEL